MSHQKKKKKGVPERWLDYCPVGRRIPRTRFIAFKVPLKPSLNCRVPESRSFGLWDLLDSVKSQDQELGLIIDLTFTTRYYGLSDVPRSCSYVKILTEGGHVPSDAAILGFKRAVRRFLRENRDNDKLIGVHCTHGLNRTGYLVCRYLIDVDGLNPAAAIELFNSCRGHRIERRNYVDDLQSAAKRTNDGIDEPEKEEAVRGLATERPPRAAAAAGEAGQQVGNDPAETRQPAGDRRRRRRARHHHRADHKSCERPPQDGLCPAPSVLPAYCWSPASKPETPLPLYSWSGRSSL